MLTDAERALLRLVAEDRLSSAIHKAKTHDRPVGGRATIDAVLEAERVAKVRKPVLSTLVHSAC
eukprot:COSAG05_NODE_782_length_7373_cov_4.015122_5_plen_64_part_00